jgi:hypothetical protein
VVLHQQAKMEQEMQQEEVLQQQVSGLFKGLQRG